MKTQLITGISILVLLVGVIGSAGIHHAEAKGMPIHNPNWAKIVADPTSQNGHAPVYDGTAKIVPKNTADQKTMPVMPKTTTQTQSKDTSTSQNGITTKPTVQKINRDNQIKSESAKIASDKAKANALIKANTHNSDIKVNQKPK